MHGLVHHKLVLDGPTINLEYCLVILRRLLEKACQNGRNYAGAIHGFCMITRHRIETKFNTKNATNSIGS